MSLLLNVFRLKNRLSSLVFPNYTAEKASQLFLEPRRFPLKEWEVGAELNGNRKQYDGKVSAITWGSGESVVLLMHGWESRATQLYRLITPLLSEGYKVIGLDGPAHGDSPGKQANPVMFARAIKLLNQHEGPFDAMIGHSMGASAVAISSSEGVTASKIVLISSPSSILTVLERFSKFIGLSKDVCHRFVRRVSTKVGREAKSLDVPKLMSENDASVLVIHDENDLEIPFEEGLRIANSLPQAKLLSTTSLGHRKIVSDENVREQIAEFITS